MSYRGGGNRRFMRGKGDRYRNEHDDRESSGGNNMKNHYRNFTIYRQNDRSARVPDGHWRGDKDRRGGGNFRGHRNNRQGYTDEDGGRNNRREGMYKARGYKKGNRDKHNQNSFIKAGWNKIIIKDAGPLDKDEVMGAIRRVVQQQFTPIMYEPEGINRVFYLEDNAAAVQAIRDISRRVSISSGQKLLIQVNRSAPPVRALTAEQREKVTSVMSERYCVELKRLDLKNFHNDAGLVAADIFCPLCRLPNMKIIVDVIVGHIPLVEEIDFSSNKLYSLEETNRLVGSCPNLKRLILSNNKLANIETLSHLQGMNIMDISLEGNGLCNKFRDTESYISAVRKWFPKVLYLDGQELPRPIGFEVDDDDTSTMPKILTSYFAVPGVKDLVLQFIEQYYQIFDSEDRTPLAAAYTEDATFSLACTFPESGPGARYTHVYVNESRNLKKNLNSDKRMQNLHRGRSNIIALLSKLPFTTHDPNSFTVDVPVAEANLIHVTLTGVFRQLSDRAPLVRSFSRTFIVVPQGNGYCICNEKLFITTATVEQIKKSFKSPVPESPEKDSTPQRGGVASPSLATEPQLSPAQMSSIVKFCEASGMLPEYSRMCLEQNNWDFNKAGELFTQLKTENKIPPEYFSQSP
ncbi:nuclear RNA export factor 1-like [Macrobrachium rosenbergii]|uniref:nuclear RNA export factor 1-like n=1 Tax=Macrobrachium rosenbergii TaxID=79674 RepID=UPI0034D56C4A